MSAKSVQEPQWAALGRGVLRYRRSGTGSQPLLLLHEMGGTLESWDGVVPFLDPHFDVVRCDMRGAGMSEKLIAPITFPDFADDFAELVDHLALPGRIDIAGVAVGGCLSLLFASRHPGRVRRLVPINPPTNATGPAGQVLRERAVQTDEGGIRAVIDSTLARSFPEEVMGDGSAFRAYRARFLANDPTSYAFILRALAAVDFTGVLERITAPTRFLSARYDKIRPPAQIAEVAKAMPGAQFREIAGGHVANVQAPDTLAREILDFLHAQP